MLINNKNFIYIYTIKDYFSKFADSYLIENKTSSTIFKYTKKFFDKNNQPLEFGTYKRREFVNHVLMDCLNERNIR